MKPPAKNQKWPCLTSTYSDQIKKGIIKIKIHPPVLEFIRYTHIHTYIHITIHTHYNITLLGIAYQVMHIILYRVQKICPESGIKDKPLFKQR